MFSRVRQEWHEIKRHPPGERFEAFYRRRQERSSKWTRLLYFGAAFIAFGVGVILAFIPGPAVVFFALTGALLSTQSSWVARQLDKGEVFGRRVIASARGRLGRARHRRRLSH